MLESHIKMMDRRSVEKISPFFLAALVIVCYSNSLQCGLVYDDIAAIRDNRDLRPHTPFSNLFLNDFWGTPLKKETSHKSYRPLTVLTFRLNYAFHALAPFGYHLVNIFLHTFVTWLFYRFSLYFLSENTSLVSSALFAVHPVHTEAVTSVVGRAELLSASAFLGALIFYVKSRCQTKKNIWQQCSLTTVLALLGMLCKEQGLTVLAVCCIYELASNKNPSRAQSIRYLMQGRGIDVPPWLRESVLRVGLLLIAAVAALSLRWHIMGPRLPTFSRFDNPAAVSASPTRQLTYNYLLSVNTVLLLFPCHLCCDWTMSTIPLISCLYDIRNLATLAFYLAAFVLVRYIFKLEEDTRLAAIMSLSLLTIPFLPASNLFFPVGFVVAERVLYIPSMGFCMLVAQGWSTLWDKKSYRQLAGFGLIFLITVHAIKTAKRNYDWQSDYTLYSSAIAMNQRNGKLYNNMGQVLESMSRLSEALRHYENAIRIQPDDVRSYLNVGRALTSLGRYSEAEDIYLQAKNLLPQPRMPKDKEISVTPNHLQLFLNLAFLISRNDSRLEEADQLYRQAITLRSDFTNAYLSRGDVLLKMNRTKEAEAMYHRALEHDNTNPDLYFNLGVVLMDQGRNSEALDIFNKALDIDPDHEKSLVYSAILIQETGMSSFKNLARDRLEKIVDQGKENERVYINLGLMALDNKDYRSAEGWFKKILQVKPSSRSALFNLALMLSEQQRQNEAISFLNLLLEHHPSHVNGLILMADINVNHLRDLGAAEECYRKVLKLEPDNVKALHNLCVVYVEEQNFARAERCFSRASSVHPQVDYIRRHLELVRDLMETRHGPELDSNSKILNSFAASPSVS